MLSSPLLSLSLRAHAKLILGEQDSFHVNHIYKDDDTYSVVGAAAEILGESQWHICEGSCSVPGLVGM